METEFLLGWLSVLSAAIGVLWRHSERLHQECRTDRDKLWQFLLRDGTGVRLNKPR